MDRWRESKTEGNGCEVMDWVGAMRLVMKGYDGRWRAVPNSQQIQVPQQFQMITVDYIGPFEPVDGHVY